MGLWRRWRAWWGRDPWIAGLTPVAVVLLLLAAWQVVALVDDVRDARSARTERLAVQAAQQSGPGTDQGSGQEAGDGTGQDSDNPDNPDGPDGDPDSTGDPDAADKPWVVSVRGVVRGPDGSPVAGARVSGNTVAHPTVPGSRWSHFRAVTDERGRFRLTEALRDERLWISVRPPRSSGLAARFLGGGTDGTEVRPLRLTSKVNRVELRLEQAATISGTVRDRRGAALTDGGQVTARVLHEDLEPADDTAVVRRARIRPDGSFRLTGLSPGEYVVGAGANGAPQWAFHPDESRARDGALVRVRAGEELSGTDVTVPDPGTLSGRVLDPDGAPVAGVRVSVNLPQPVGPTIGSCCIMDLVDQTTTDAVGRYQFTDRGGFSDLRLSVAPRPRSGFVRCVPSVATGFRVDEDVRHDFRLERGATVAGRVTEPGGRPLAGKRVSAVVVGGPGGGCTTRAVTRSDDQGRFRLQGLGGGTVRLRVADDESHLSTHRSGTGPVEVRVRPDGSRSGVRLTVRRAARVEGRMVLPASATDGVRRPREVCLHGQVARLPRNPSWCQGWKRVRRFSFTGLEPGRYWLTARWDEERYYTGDGFSDDGADTEVFDLAHGTRHVIRVRSRDDPSGIS